jgi:hypothetical protein
MTVSRASRHPTPVRPKEAPRPGHRSDAGCDELTLLAAVRIPMTEKQETAAVSALAQLLVGHACMTVPSRSVRDPAATNPD